MNRVEQSKRRRLTPERYVYVITDGKRCKIGMAACVYTRLKQLQVGNHRELEIVQHWVLDSKEKAAEAEHRAQGKFGIRKIRGEWYDATPEEVMAVLDPMFEHLPNDIARHPLAPPRYLSAWQRSRLEE